MTTFECPKGCPWTHTPPATVKINSVSHPCPKATGKQVEGKERKEEA